MSTLDAFLIFYFVDRFNEREIDSKFKIITGITLQASLVIIFSTYQPLNNFAGKLVLFALICILLRYFFLCIVPQDVATSIYCNFNNWNC